MNYKSVASLNADLKHWLTRLPRDLELIVGIPRSGLMAASILALHANLPLTDVHGLIAGRIFRGGLRQGNQGHRTFLSTPRRVLVLDDSLMVGGALARERTAINRATLPHEVLYGAVYIAPGKEKVVDHYCKVVPHPRAFEWNLMHHECLANACLDIDGVLCIDPTEHENDDGPRYSEFLSNAKPYLLPTVKVGWLVTCRLEKYRSLTEAWLRKHGVQYKKLVMLDLPDRAARVAANSHGAYKAEVYRQTGADLFIESNPNQARDIARISGFSVFCTETGEMLNAGAERPEERDRFAAFAPQITDELNRIIPADARFAVVDDAMLLGCYIPASPRVDPFLEKDGQYNGPPLDDQTAINELNRMRTARHVSFLAFTWVAFWWLDHYADFHQHLRKSFTTVVDNERMVVFDLRG